MTEKGKVSIVIPALNEEKGISRTISAIPWHELKLLGYGLEVVVVDNGSNDKTAELAQQGGAKVVPEPRKGYGNALKAGFASAEGNIIVTADADATYPVDDIPRLVRMLDSENLDFITTNRFASLRNDAMSRRNRIGNAVLSLTMKALFSINIQDSQSGMWVFRRKILENLRLNSNTPLSQEIKIEACHFARLAWKEVPIEYRPRSGHAKLGGWRVGLGNLFHLLKKRIVR